MTDKTIKVWRYVEAPKAYRDLSLHGGDEDWVAFVPMFYDEDHLGWLQSGTPFGCCDVSEHRTDKGTVYIGAHS